MDKSYRYKQLDRLLRCGNGYTLNDIIVRLDDDISKRTLQRELAKLEKPPYNMEFVQDMYRGKEKIIRYKDTTKSLFDIQDEMQHRFNSVKSALDELSGIPQYDWMKYLFVELSNNTSLDAQSVISFDNNYDLVGLEHLAKLTKSIVHKCPLKLVYKTFRGHKLCVNIHPYHLRQYNNRWFLLCKTEGKETISTYALDRIKSITDSSIRYVDTEVDFEEWFDDVIGVTVSDSEIQDVLIRVKKDRYGYIKTKPLHHSQTEIKELIESDHVYIKIKVRMNNELVTTLISYGADLEVLQPAVLRNQIKEIVLQMYSVYSEW